MIIHKDKVTEEIEVGHIVVVDYGGQWEIVEVEDEIGVMLASALNHAHKEIEYWKDRAVVAETAAKKAWSYSVTPVLKDQKGSELKPKPEPELVNPSRPYDPRTIDYGVGG